jgi:hypothetical protein
VEAGEMAFARQQLDKHMSTVTDTHAAVEELLEIMFSVWSLPRLYREDTQEKLVALSSQSWL